MVDRNGNGIPDDRERKYGVPGPGKSPYPAGGRPAPKVKDTAKPTTGSVSPMDRLFSGLRNAGVGIGVLLRSNGPAQSNRARPGGGSWAAPGTSPSPSPEEKQLTLADYLRQASEMLSSSGAGGGVNYDPQRNTLRQNASENDARLEAMYRQLRGSIDADAPVLQQAYQGAIDATQQNTQQAQEQTQAASDAAYARNNEVLSNLGIQQAQGNQIINGTDLASQTARQVGDQADRGQAATNRLASNQATAIQHNTNIGNAAGLEGNLQRASNNARLQSLLAEIDMQEQQQNAGRQDNSFSQQLGLAQELLGFDRYNQERQDNLQMSAAEAAAKQKTALPNFDQMIQALAARGIAIPEDPRQLATLLDSARRYSFG